MKTTEILFWASLNVSVGLCGKPCHPDSRVENAQLAVKVQHTLSGTWEEFGAACQLSVYGSGSAPVYISCKPKWHFFSSVIRVNAIRLPGRICGLYWVGTHLLLFEIQNSSCFSDKKAKKIHLFSVVNVHHCLGAAVNHWATSLFRSTRVFFQGQWELEDTYGERVKNLREMG